MQGIERELVKKLVRKLMDAKTVNFTKDLVQRGKVLMESEETVTLKLDVTNPQSPEVLELINELGLVMPNTNNQQILKLSITRGKSKEDDPNQLTIG